MPAPSPRSAVVLALPSEVDSLVAAVSLAAVLPAATSAVAPTTSRVTARLRP